MPNPNEPQLFSASDSMLGYFYQARVALLVALRLLRNDESFAVQIETVDDISVHGEDGDPIEVLQTKHHRTRIGDLSDLSADIWKTIRIWSDGIRNGSIGSNCACVIITTAAAPGSSAASHLKNTSRNPIEAWRLFHSAMQRSANTALAPSFEAFRLLGEDKQRALISQIYIQDAQPDIINIEQSFQEELFQVVRSDHWEAYLERLEGWWLRRVLSCLKSPIAISLSREEIQNKIDQLRDQFGPESLPIDDDLLSAVVMAGPPYTDMPFVKQIEAIPAPRHVIFAIRDYYRAFTQRSRWMRQQLIYPEDLSRYENQLQEAWERRFVQMEDVLGDAPGADMVRQEALRILSWCEDHSHPPIRRNCTERFVAVGTYHIMADDLRVGWHPKFREKLAHLLDQAQTGSEP